MPSGLIIRLGGWWLVQMHLELQIFIEILLLGKIIPCRILQNILSRNLVETRRVNIYIGMGSSWLLRQKSPDVLARILWLFHLIVNRWPTTCTCRLSPLFWPRTATKGGLRRAIRQTIGDTSRLGSCGCQVELFFSLAAPLSYSLAILRQRRNVKKEENFKRNKNLSTRLARCWWYHGIR